MSDDFYSYPDIDDEGGDIFSNDAVTDEIAEPSLSKRGEFKVTIPDEELRVTRRPTSKPVRSDFDLYPSAPVNRTPQGRKMSAVEPRPPQSYREYTENRNDIHRPPQQPTVQPRYAQERPQPRPQTPYRAPSSRPPEVSSVRSERPEGRGAQERRASSVSSGNPKKKGKRIAVSIICVLLALLLLVGGYGFFLLGKINYDDSTSGRNEYISSSQLAHSSFVKNILIIGSDARGDVSGMRSDTMILASIDSKHRQLKLTSFLRDSYVYIPEKQIKAKLNAAFAYGGAKMTIDTLEYNFKVRIDSYVIVDFELFTEFINALGGVDVSGITEAEVNWLKRNVDGINIHPGTSHLTGGAALWYCRVRKIDSDFKRTERQRKVVSAVIDQVKKTNPVTTFNAVKKVLPMITTDIGRGSLMSLGINAIVRYMHYDTFQAQVPAEGTWRSEHNSAGAVLAMDIDKNAEILKNFIYEKQTKE